MMADLFANIHAFFKLMVFMLTTLVLMPFQFLWLLFASFRPTRHQSPIVRLWFLLMTNLIGIRVILRRKEYLSTQQSILLSNHISYLDIIILGYLLDAFFVAKSDIADWPFFGFLSKISSAVFISRNPRDVKSQIAHLESHLQRGKSLIVFPEGTTSNGREVLPFKAGFLNAIVNMPVQPVIQPISITYTRLNGNSLAAQNDSDVIAWYGDMVLAPHLWSIFKQRSLEVVIQIYPALAVNSPVEPKKLAQDVQAIVASGFADQWATALQEYSHSGQG